MKTLQEIFSKNSKVNQILCAILINLPVFSYGASIGWMSPMALLLQSEKSPRATPLTNNEEAVRVLAWLRCQREDDKSIKEEIDLMRMEQNNTAENDYFLVKTILKDTVLSKAFYLALVVIVARELCGAVPILNFAGYIFNTAATNHNLIITPNQQSMLLGVVQVSASMFAPVIVDKSGRKILLLISALLSGLSMFSLASWFVAKDYGVIVPNWIPIFTLCIYVFCNSSGLQPVCMVLIREIFSDKYRGIVLATTISLSSFTNFLEVLFFQPIIISTGIYVPFYIFGAASVFFVIFVIIVIPETKGKSLVEIYKHFTKK